MIAIIWTAVSIPVVVIEQVGYSDAIGRSRALASGRWGHVLGALVLSWVIAIGLFMGVSFGLGMLGVPDRVESAVRRAASCRGAADPRDRDDVPLSRSAHPQ